MPNQMVRFFKRLFLRRPLDRFDGMSKLERLEYVRAGNSWPPVPGNEAVPDPPELELLLSKLRTVKPDRDGMYPHYAASFSKKDWELFDRKTSEVAVSVLPPKPLSNAQDR